MIGPISTTTTQINNYFQIENHTDPTWRRVLQQRYKG